MSTPISKYTYKNPRQKWLYQRGGRQEGDVQRDQVGDFVWMMDGMFEVKVYLPLNCQRENIAKLGDGLIHTFSTTLKG